MALVPALQAGLLEVHYTQGVALGYHVSDFQSEEMRCFWRAVDRRGNIRLITVDVLDLRSIQPLQQTADD
jgi:hypothetical protein